MEGHKKFHTEQSDLAISTSKIIQISQSEFPGTRKFILRYQSFEGKKGAEM